MKTLLTSTVAVGLMASAAFAGPATDTATIGKAPTLMTDSQLDKVVAGIEFSNNGQRVIGTYTTFFAPDQASGGICTSGNSPSGGAAADSMGC